VPMTEETMKAKQKHDEMLRKFHIEMRARTIAAPTNDMDVKLQLRRFNEPICLFGEGPAERRDRLKNILARMEVEQGISANEVVAASAKHEMNLQRSKQEAHDANEVFYTEGTEELKAARLWIMDYSLPRSGRRVREAKRKQVELADYIARKEAKIKENEAKDKAEAGGKAPAPEHEEDTRMDEESQVEQEQNVYMDRAGKYRNMDLACSQVGDVRPISGCHFSADAKTLATASWSGLAKIWSVPECEEKFTLFGHAERLTDVKFHPAFSSSSMGASEGGSIGCATASVDKTVKLWRYVCHMYFGICIMGGEIPINNGLTN